MNQYQEQAAKFLADTGIRLTVAYKEYGPYFDDKTNHHIFKFTLRRAGKSYTATFGQSIAAGPSLPSAYDILSCLNPNEVETADDLISEHGYEVSSVADIRRLERMARQLKRQNEGLRRLFTSDQLEQLAEIN